MSRGGFGAQALKHLPPGPPGISIALEIGKSIVQNLLFCGAESRPSDEVLLLQFTKPAKDLVSLVCAQLRKLREDIGFTHEPTLAPYPIKGK